MTIKTLPGYISYGDCQKWLPFLRSNRDAELIEASGGVHGEVPMEERIGSIVRTVKENHVARFIVPPTAELTQIKTEFVDGDAPEFPEEADWVGIFYFGRRGDEFQSSPEKIGDKEISPDYGDVVFFRATTEYSEAEVSEGINERLYIFWSQHPKA